jgi:hypothetical protein
MSAANVAETGPVLPAERATGTGVACAVADGDSKPNWRVAAMVGLYPPAWRVRYGTEFAALLVDVGVRARQVVDIVPAAAAAWVRPAARLHTQAGRMRATAAVTLCAWTALAAGAILFAKITRDGAWYLADQAHPVAAWWYNCYSLAASMSVLAMVVGWLPLVITMLRASRRGPRRRRVLALLAVPPTAMLGFMTIAAAMARLVEPAAAQTGTGIGTGWFVALSALGLTASAACAAGPAAALTHTRPDGPLLKVTVLAGSCAIALMVAATTASLAYGLAQHQSRAYTLALTMYGITMAAALLVATISSRRGLRAAFPPADRSRHAR